MKYFLVVLLAAAVTAAPSSTPNLSPFQEYAIDFPVFSEFGKNLAKYWETAKCAQDVVAQVVSESEFKPVWDEYKSKIQSLVTVEWPKCEQETDVAEQIKCKAAVVQTAVATINGFVKKLTAVNKLELVKEIKEKVVAKCFKSQSALFEFEPEGDEFNGDLHTQFECIAKILDKVSNEHNLQELWSKSQPQLLHHMNKLKQCDKAGNQILVGICKVKEVAASYAITTEYLKLADAQDPTFVKDFGLQYKENCVDKSYTDELIGMFAVEGIEACVQKLVEKLKCISEAVSEAVKETEFHAVWEQAKHDLVHLQNKLKACQNEEYPVDVAKCITKALKGSYEILGKFLANLKQANQAAYNKVKETIKKKCYSA